MSPLPERRKTPEELAALRQSLGIPAEAPGASTQVTPQEIDLPAPPEVPADDPPELELAEALEVEADDAEDGHEEVVRVGSPRPVRSLRKSAGLAVDRPKGQIARGDSGMIPARRHSDDELNQIRRASQLTSSVADILPKAAHPGVLMLLYGVGVLTVLIVGLGVIAQSVPMTDLPFEWLMVATQKESFSMALFTILAIGSTVLLVGAGWVAWARPLSRHHAGFMTIIAVLVLVFGTLYFFPELHGA